MSTTDQEVVVRIYDGLYYDVVLRERTTHLLKQCKMVHENQLERTIADMLRGPSIISPKRD